MTMRCTLALRSPGWPLLALVFAIAGCQRAAKTGDERAGAAFVRAVQSASTAPPPAQAAPDSVAHESPATEVDDAAAISRELDLDAAELDAQAALERGNWALAADLYSRLLLSALRGVAPEDRATLARWSEKLSIAQAKHRWSRDGAWPSVEETVLAGDGLIAVRKRVVAKHPDLKVSTGLIARSNGLADDATLQPGTRLRIPTEPVSVIVDLSARWLVYLHGAEVVAAWEVGVGRAGKETPSGRYTVGLKQRNPMWFPEGRPAVAYGDPANPLGTRWIGWVLDGRETSLGFHGTNSTGDAGAAVSEGCIRLRNAEVEILFDILPEGTVVLVQS
jgi:lipoprotein-anchoring transpeptidase ErfK/SrfK